jgi:TetR/AcrR family transcriptional repressor of nem operon
MGSELARADLETRRAASQGFRELIDVIARQGGASDTASATGDAMFTLSAIIGAVTMSRIVDDPELSDLILDETRKRLTALGVEPRETSLG